MCEPQEALSQAWQADLAAAEKAARSKKKAREESAEREKERSGEALHADRERARERVEREVREMASNDVEGQRRRERARAEKEEEVAARAVKEKELLERVQNEMETAEKAARVRREAKIKDLREQLLDRCNTAGTQRSGQGGEGGKCEGGGGGSVHGNTAGTQRRGDHEESAAEDDNHSELSKVSDWLKATQGGGGLEDSHGCEGSHGAEDGGRDVPGGGGGEYTIWQMARHGKVQDLMAYFDSLGNDMKADVRDTYGNSCFTTHSTD